MLDQATLKKFFHYDPGTGIFTRKFREREYFKTEQQFYVWNKRFANKVADHMNQTGYIEFYVDYVLYKAHRLAFLYMEGEFPESFVDHINHIKHDNRWVNLRKVKPRENSMKRTMNKNNTSGVNGVNWYPRYNKWAARLGNNFKRKFVGYFDTIE